MKKFTTYVWQYLVVAVLCTSMIVMTGCSVDQVLTDVDIALQASQSIIVAVGAISPADAAAVSLLAGVATTGLQVIQQDYKDYEANKSGSALQKVLEAVQVLQANLKQNLAAATITDPVLLSKVTAWVNLVEITLVAVTQLVKPPSNKVTAVALPTPLMLQAKWNNEVCGGNEACTKLVKVHKKHSK